MVTNLSFNLEVNNIRSNTTHLVELPFPMHPMSNKRRARMNLIRCNPEIISVYSDSSSIVNSNVVGLAGCFSGNGNSYVAADKQYLAYGNETFYGELLAVSLCLGILPIMLSDYRSLLLRPSRVTLYTDMELIGRVQDGTIVFKKSHYDDAASDLRRLLAEVRSDFPFVEINVEYLSRSLRQGNSYYKAAHKAARRVIGK